MYWSCDSGRRHAGLASRASWQRAAEEGYDDARELIVREKSRFLAVLSSLFLCICTFYSQELLLCHSLAGNTQKVCNTLQPLTLSRKTSGMCMMMPIKGLSCCMLGLSEQQ